MDENLQLQNRIPWYTALGLVLLAGFADLIQVVVGLLGVALGAAGAGLAVIPIIGPVLALLKAAGGFAISGAGPFLVTLFFGALFLVIFRVLGVSALERLSGRTLVRLMVYLIGFVIELTPLISALLPGWLLTISITCVLVWMEDAAHNKEVEERRRAITKGAARAGRRLRSRMVRRAGRLARAYA
ncbi:hypothetical protein GVX82_03095 [Patescibacteria group bacterium]|jgi:hypothetical protein|nr:hypothetical protein [Patescibacteria group bacterium]